VSGVGCRVSGVGCRVSGVGCRVSGVGCRVSGVGEKYNGLFVVFNIVVPWEQPEPILRPAGYGGTSGYSTHATRVGFRIAEQASRLLVEKDNM